MKGGDLFGSISYIYNLHNQILFIFIITSHTIQGKLNKQNIDQSEFDSDSSSDTDSSDSSSDTDS